MGVKWTKQQQKVIDLRNRNILVSAAAGSGKTAVLVERIIQRITDEQCPVDVDNLLIVTFTEAAAAEMKDRIRAAIEKRLEENPGNEHLEQQATLVHSAPITTIHSFCLSVIREHFHVIDLDPGFRIGEEGELKLLKQDVLDELLEERYAEGDQEFLSFTERFGTGKNDRKIEGIILKLYEYSRSYPQPVKWLDQCVEIYGKDEAEEKLVQQMLKHVYLRVNEPEKLLQRCLKICEEPDGPYMYGDMLESDLLHVENIRRSSDFAKMYRAVTQFEWKTLSRKKDDSVSPEKRELVKSLRDQAKKAITGIKEMYFYTSENTWKEDLLQARGSVETAVLLVKQFAEKFAEKKRSRNMIDFNDMEQFALAVLTEEKEGELVPSVVAREYAKQFEEIMIDEYQDSNFVQETILTSVSGQADGRNNIFMVGDVKQSIYSFRLSRPELFMEKYNTYSVEDSEKQRIDLHKNFRSREEVLDGVNYIFHQIMKKEMGGIEYDDNAALYAGASFPEIRETDERNKRSDTSEQNDLFKTELLVLAEWKKDTENVRRTEARMIAKRIRKLMREGIVFDKETETYRPVKYKDIVILTRSVKGWAEDFSAVLAEEGIPAYSVSREGYFAAYEVSVLLDYLKILDNGRQDLPLAAALTSPFGRLRTEEMAKIRMEYPDTPFYESARLYASAEANDPVLQKKLSEFFEQVDRFRGKVSYTPIHELLEEIIEETGFGIYIGAMEGGAQRTANIEMLVEKAKAFEGTSYKGLFHFVRYIEQLKKYDVDYGEAGTLDEQADTVRIMSIHKSKGLEFPIVFAAGMGKSFNTQDTKSSMLLHPKWGIGVDKINLERRTKAPTFLKKVIREELMYEMWSEEMRILYVALTRAKDKLIMTGVLPHHFVMQSGENGVITTGAKSYFDWIMPALWSETAGGVRKDAPVDVFYYTQEDLKPDVSEVKAEELALDVLKHWDAEKVYDLKFRDRLDEQMKYVYPYDFEGSMKLKFTVSELKKRTILQEESGEEMYKEPEVVPLIPHFIKKEDTLSGASRGSAYHKMLELLDFAKEYDESGLEAELEKLTEAGRLSKEMADCIRIEDMMHFLQTKSGSRMSRAARKEMLYKEQPFVIGVDASEIYPGDQSGEKILVQGIIDVYFEEEDGLVVLDYKTDQVKNGKELAEKYHAQLEYYAQALSQLTGKCVKEKIIYSFTLKEEINV